MKINSFIPTQEIKIFNEEIFVSSSKAPEHFSSTMKSVVPNTFIPQSLMTIKVILYGLGTLLSLYVLTKIYSILSFGWSILHGIYRGIRFIAKGIFFLFGATNSHLLQESKLKTTLDRLTLKLLKYENVDKFWIVYGAGNEQKDLFVHSQKEIHSLASKFEAEIKKNPSTFKIDVFVISKSSFLFFSDKTRTVEQIRMTPQSEWNSEQTRTHSITTTFSSEKTLKKELAAFL